jgi:hypothetical protein
MMETTATYSTSSGNAFKKSLRFTNHSISFNISKLVLFWNGTWDTESASVPSGSTWDSNHWHDWLKDIDRKKHWFLGGVQLQL